MPWGIVEEAGKHCIYKLGDDDKPMGDTLSCHDTPEEARTQQQALYASEAQKATGVKFTNDDETEIEGLLAPYFGPFAGKDLAGEFFSPKTDFVLDLFPDGARPLMYHHGLDKDAGVSAIGRIKTLKKTDAGLWMEAQLDAANEYFESIKQLIKQGKLGLSSGSMPHLVSVDKKTGEILRWPLFEGSTTPSPCNPLAEVDFATAKAHFKSAGMELPDEDALKAKLDQAALNKLPDSDFAYIDSKGGRHLPMHDEAHAQNALARFNQTEFESTEAKEAAKKKLLARANELGIEVADQAKSVAYVRTMDGNSWMCDSGTWTITDSNTSSYTIWVDGNKTITNATGPEMGDEQHPPMVEKKPAKMGMPEMMAMMMAMAKEMGMDMSDEDAEAMMNEMGDMEDMSEEGMKQKMQAALEKCKEENSKKTVDIDAVKLVNWLLEEDIDLTEMFKSVPLVNHAEAVKIFATSVLERTKDLHERRVKEGRILSTSNRKRLGECVDAMRKTSDELQAILDSTDKQPAKAVDPRMRLRLQALQQYEHTFN